MTILRSFPIGLLGLLLAAAGANAQEAIKIGLIQPLTGSVAYNGTSDVNGVQAGAERNQRQRRRARQEG